MKDFWKSVDTSRSYGQKVKCLIFETQCTENTLVTFVLVSYRCNKTSQSDKNYTFMPRTGTEGCFFGYDVVANFTEITRTTVRFCSWNCQLKYATKAVTAQATAEIAVHFVSWKSSILRPSLQQNRRTMRDQNKKCWESLNFREWDVQRMAQTCRYPLKSSKQVHK